MTDKFEPKELSFSIFRNTYKKEIKQPDLTGKLRMDGKDHNIALWKKDGQLKGKVNIGYQSKEQKGVSVDFILNKNARKDPSNEAHKTYPDRVGELRIEGIVFTIGGYDKVSKTGLKFISGSLKESTGKQPAKKVKLENEDSIFDF